MSEQVGQNKSAKRRGNYTQRLQAFFATPEHTVDVDSLCDFLQYRPGTRKQASTDTRPASERLQHILSGIKFKRLDDYNHVSHQENDDVHSLELLDTLIAQSDQQNMITSRFMALLNPVSS